MTWIEEAKEKLFLLKAKDEYCLLFGADWHQYSLGKPLSAFEVNKIEERFDIALPTDYREFLLRIGNGGAGPGYGVYGIGNFPTKGNLEGGNFYSTGMSLERWKYHLLECRKLFALRYFKFAMFHWNHTKRFSKVFPLKDNYVTDINLIPEEDPEYDVWLRDFEENILHPGNYPIAYFGCDMTATLVLNGVSQGNIWMHSEDNYSLHDTKQSFSQFYLSWLDKSLSVVEERYQQFKKDSSVWP